MVSMFYFAMLANFCGAMNVNSDTVALAECNAEETTPHGGQTVRFLQKLKSRRAAVAWGRPELRALKKAA